MKEAQYFQLKIPQLPAAFYPQALLEIKGIKFTSRHIDIIACVVNGSTDKIIARLLSISLKTVESHKKDIRARIREKFPEDIISFILKSEKVELVRHHYLKLLNKFEFEQELQLLSKMKSKKDYVCIIKPEPISKKLQQSTHDFLNLLIGHLKLAGITIGTDSSEQEALVPTLYIVTESFQQEEATKSENIIFLLQDKNRRGDFLKQIGKTPCIDFSDPKNYLAAFAALMKEFYPETKLDKLLSVGNGSVKDKLFDSSPYQAISSASASSQKEPLNNFGYSFHKRRQWKIGIVIAICFSIVSFLFLECNDSKTSNKSQSHTIPFIRSDLSVPTDNVFLQRPQLITQIDGKFSNQKGIQTVVLLGIGGSGKTTLARHYVRQHKASLVWEVNAQTRGSLRSSFERLAYSLAAKQEEQKILRGLQEISDVEEKERELILFVQERLRTYPNWFLIYDNLEMRTFSEIKSYLPQDTEIWGEGQVLITTRDSTIKNTKYIPTQNIVDITILNKEEKLTLFARIYYECESWNLDENEKDKANKFLENIACFPLDVSTAAYYIKDTRLSFEEYLKRIKELREDFNISQESLMREIGEYTHTRYEIIATTLKEIIAKNPDFRDLLLFISLLDSQNIPIDLLQTCKSKLIVENLIHNLRKYSLVTDESSLPGINENLSMHRSTLEISLYYLTRSSDSENRKHLIEKFLFSLEHYIEQAIDSLNLPKMNILVAHCRAMLSHEHLLSTKIKGVLNSKLGVMLFFLGQDTRARQLMEQSFADLNKDKDKNHIRLVWLLGYLGDIYRYKGDYEKAKELLNRSLESYKKYDPQNYSKIAWVLVCLATTYWPLGDYKNAEFFLRQCEELYEKHPPKNRNILAWCLVTLGIIYREKGQYEESKIFLERSLAIYQEDPDNYLGVNWVLANLGEANRILGYPEKAKSLLEQSCRRYREYYPEDHIRIAPALIFLGDTNRSLGNYEVAKKLLEQGCVIYNKNFPKDYIWAAWASSTLACIYREKGQYKKALDLLEQSLVIYKKYYGKNHTEVARKLNELGQVYFLENHLDKAEAIFCKALTIFETKKHLDAFIVLEALAELYIKRSTQAENEKRYLQAQNLKSHAIACLSKSLKIIEPNLRRDSPHIKRIQSKVKALIESISLERDRGSKCNIPSLAS
ncbi:tetratricopeptide repeat protein [Candidatus Odyssella acanthamoebae]|uniref:Uncharacterized protein n=1 Tax=Candidatus Odyssella acanthamoebae TaxID=91604 RepID=A0A077B0V1_9PROT|nr:tetratricopeptide repeat protein [Candidatus Paracaedibacter acanthamoebae]AIK96565.1 hypothetical protein ID47_07230 [Candidatus Paracaedibacter acanthamoebae]